MATEIKIPELGENIESGDVVSLLVKPGDSISVDQSVLELETGKATIEIPSTSAGRVKEILVQVGDKANVGQTVLTIDVIGEAKADKKPTAKTKSAPKANKAAKKATKKAAATPSEQVEPEASGTPIDIDVVIPELGENIESGDIVSLLVKVGDSIAVEGSLLEIETGKATIEVPSTVAGIVKEIKLKVGDKAQVGQTAVVVHGTEPAKKKTKPTATPVAAPATPANQSPSQSSIQSSLPLTSSSDGAPVAAAPSVRKFAREIGVDITKVKPGENGRITTVEVKQFAKEILATPQQGGSSIATPPLPDFTTWGEVERKPMSNIRIATAQHMAACWSTIPHVTQHGWADATQMEKLRKRYAKKAEDAGGKLSMTAILIKIMAAAMKTFPQFSSSIDTAANEIIYKKYVNIGVAVDTPKGLLVPVLRNVDQLSIVEIAVELGKIAAKARDGKLPLADMQGSSMTITNLGGIGGTHFTPIVNHPEVAILGVGRGSMQPIYENEQFVPRLMIPLSLSYDHRVIDGADGARYLKWITEAIQEPLLISLEG